MKDDYDAVKGTSPHDRPEDDAVYAWYVGDPASAGLTCPVCFAMVATPLRAARGHMQWHEQGGPHSGR